MQEGLQRLGHRVGKWVLPVHSESDHGLVALPLRDGPRQALVSRRIEGVYRSDRFRDLIGNQILRFRALHEKDSGGVQLLLAIFLERYSPRAVVDLSEYSDQFMGGALNWMIVSPDGKAVIRLFGEGMEFEMGNRLVSPPEAKAEPSRYSLFSERNQWLFKCLLLPGMPSSYWCGPPDKARSVVDLAEKSGIPQPSVSVFLRQAEAAGYVKRDGRAFRVIRHRELLEEWSFAARFNPPESMNVRPLFGQSFDEWSIEHPAHREQSSYVAGSHLACHVMGLGRSNNPEKILYVQDPFDVAMDRLGLVPDPSESPWAKLVRPKYPELIFQGAVWRENIWIVDILQAYLDVRLSPARGMEQAEFIYMSKLRKHFEGGRQSACSQSQAHCLEYGRRRLEGTVLWDIGEGRGQVRACG